MHRGLLSSLSTIIHDMDCKILCIMVGIIFNCGVFPMPSPRLHFFQVPALRSQNLEAATATPKMMDCEEKQYQLHTEMLLVERWSPIGWLWALLVCSMSSSSKWLFDRHSPKSLSSFVRCSRYVRLLRYGHGRRKRADSSLYILSDVRCTSIGHK